MSTMSISVDRSGLSLSPLVFSGRRDGATLGITAYNEPAMIARNRYATSSDYEDGDDILGTTLQQGVLAWNFITPEVTTEQEHRTLVAAVREAVAQLQFNVTVIVDGADAETWRCDRGNLSPVAGRSRTDVRVHLAEWVVAAPCYPVRTIA